MSWFLAFAGFSLLVILHELGHFMVAKAVGMRVEKFSLFFPPTLVSKTVGETEYAIGAIPAGGYVKITGMNPDEDLPDEVRTRAYYAQPVWKRIAVIAAGPLMNLLLAFALIFLFFWAIGPQEVTGRVGTIEKSYPAHGELRPGDKVLAVDGKRGKPQALSKLIAKRTCPERPPKARCKASEPVTLTVDRAGQQRTIRLRPIYDPVEKRMRVGFGYAADGPRVTSAPGRAFSDAADQFWFVTKETLALPARLVDAERRKEISGIVGGYEVTRQTILDDLADVLPILAIISLSLAIVNLFPFLPLDGGHIFWSIVEKVRGRPVAFSTMERASYVGVMLVLFVFMIGLSNDIDRLSGEGFRVR